MNIPSFVTHYHPVEDPPFRNLSEVPTPERDKVISMLAERRQNPSFRRVFGAKYMSLRLATEEIVEIITLSRWR